MAYYVCNFSETTVDAFDVYVVVIIGKLHVILLAVPKFLLCLEADSLGVDRRMSRTLINFIV
jgi:hypothetical protein